MTTLRWPAAFAPRLRLLVLAISDRCDQSCVHCQIWQGRDRAEALALDERLRLVDEALAAGVDEALLTGGEPLLSADLWPVAQRLKQGSARLLLATSAGRLERFASDVARLFDEVYISLDGGSAASHDALRGAPTLERVAAGIAALLRRRPRPLIVARSALHAGNIHELEAIVCAARELGCDHVSFLALDSSSLAFGGEPAARLPLVPSEAAVAGYEAAVARLEARGALADGFVLETPAKLRSLARHLRASAGRLSFERPECDAPWWSLMVEADGRVRPCFFHEAVGDARQGLRVLRAGERYRAALQAIRAPNPTCERCVCPKKRGVGLLARAWA